MSESKNFMLIHYESDNTFEVKQDHKNAFKGKKTIKVEFDGKWYVGNICYYGSKSKCEKHSRDIEDGIEIETDNDPEPYEEEAAKQSKKCK